MRYLLKHIAILQSAVLIVQAYYIVEVRPTAVRNSKPHSSDAIHQSERTQRRIFHINGAPHYVKNANSPEQRPQNGPTRDDMHNQYNLKHNRENHPKLFHETERKPQLSDASVDSSDSTRYLLSKESDDGGRNYKANYPDRQSQLAVSDKTSWAQHDAQLESREPQNKQHYLNVYEKGSRAEGNDRNLRHESRQKLEPSREYSRYHEHKKQLNTRPTYHAYQDDIRNTESPQNRRKHLESSHQNQQTAVQPAGVNDNQGGYRETHQMNHYSLEREGHGQRPTSKDLHIYQQAGYTSTQSNQKESSLSDQTPESYDAKMYNNANRQYLPNPSNERHSNLHRQPPTLKIRNRPSSRERQNVPSHPHYTERNHPHQSPTSEVTENYRDHPVSYKTQNFEEHNTDRSVLRYHPESLPKPKVQEPKRQKATEVQKRSENVMEESRDDMQTSPSEADISDEHDGFLDMGAYTDKKGSFGWYADFPVGKEHDKVTYSFSK